MSPLAVFGASIFGSLRCQTRTGLAHENSSVPDVVRCAINQRSFFMHPLTPLATLPRLKECACLLALVAVFACDADKVPTAIHPSVVAVNSLNNDRDHELTVMTYNIYQGTELENSIAATTG